MYVTSYIKHLIVIALGYKQYSVSVLLHTILESSNIILHINTLIVYINPKKLYSPNICCQGMISNQD